MGNAHSSNIGKGLSDRDLLALSVQEGHSDSIPLFLKKNPSMLQILCNNRNTLLHIAAQKGHVKALDAILKTAKEGLINGTTASYDIISKLLNQQNKAGKTALSVACSKGFADCVRCLISYGADVWVADHHGRTGLHHASLRGHSECVRVLLEKYQTALQLSVEAGADDSHDGSPTHGSHVSDHPGHKALQQTAASRYANVKDNLGITPLHCAAWSGDVETAVTLLRGGAFLAMQTAGDCYDKEITCNAGSTPLHIAALKGEIEMVTMMLCDYVSNCRDGHMHVDPRAITDAYNVTPHQLAMSREHQDVAALLNPMTLIGDMVRKQQRQADGPAKERSRSADRSLDTNRSADRSLDRNRSADMSLDRNRSADRSLDRNRSADRSLDRNRSADTSLDRSRSADRSIDRSKDQNPGAAAARPPTVDKPHPGHASINSLLSMSSEAADFISLLSSASPSSSAPDWFVCPVTGHIFADPVVASDGFTYEREAITAHLQAGNLTSPVNAQPLTSKQVYPNTVLYLAIKEWQLHMQRATANGTPTAAVGAQDTTPIASGTNAANGTSGVDTASGTLGTDAANNTRGVNHANGTSGRSSMNGISGPNSTIATIATSTNELTQ